MVNKILYSLNNEEILPFVIIYGTTGYYANWNDQTMNKQKNKQCLIFNIIMMEKITYNRCGMLRPHNNFCLFLFFHETPRF